jgi:hypothetical protein
MNSVDQRHAGIASGINNAVSRIAALLDVAVFGAMSNGLFQSSLSQKLGALLLPSTVRADVERQRPKLAGIETNDIGVQQSRQRIFRLCVSSCLVGGNGARSRQFPSQPDRPCEAAEEMAGS